MLQKVIINFLYVFHYFKLSKFAAAFYTKVFYYSSGECISNAERFYNVLSNLLLKRGKKDFAIRINYRLDIFTYSWVLAKMLAGGLCTQTRRRLMPSTEKNIGVSTFFSSSHLPVIGRFKCLLPKFCPIDTDKPFPRPL